MRHEAADERRPPNVRGALGNAVNVSRVFDGGPTNARFKGIGAAFLAPNCLKAEQDAHKTPNVTESATWQ